MNERQLQRLLRRMLVLSAPLPLALLGAACGGTALMDQLGASGTSAGGKDGGGAGTVSNGGSGGSSGGGGSAGMGMAGASSECRTLPTNCSGGAVVVPKSCLGPVVPTAGLQLATDTCKVLCSAMYVSCTVSSTDATSATVQCIVGCPVGRRPAGLGAPPPYNAASLGSYFAEMARLEAASVNAFRILRDELRAKGAPKKLVRAAARAARDEIRHARATGALARHFGSSPRPPSVARATLRSIEAMALENAVEGCVRETYGALLATRQAERAGDPLVRAALKRIARDETRHAVLSTRVDRWLDTRLDEDGRRNVERAKQAAAQELIAAVAHEGTLAFAGIVGLPSPAEGARLLTEMKQALWS